jgi:squalene cyclase
VFDWYGINPLPPEVWMMSYRLPVHPGLFRAILSFFRVARLCLADISDAIVQVECGVTAEWCIYPCATSMERGLSAELHHLYWN